MQSDSGKTQSIWMTAPGIPGQPTLSRDLHTEVVVVGGGLAGLTTAYLLSREGKEVVVIDDGPFAGGETSRTTAHLTNVADARYYRIAQVHGEDGARLFAESHTAAIDRIEEIVRSERIECEFERLDAFLFANPGDPSEELEHEFEAARRAGVDVEWADETPLSDFRTGLCLRFPHQAQFHPLRYLAALASAIERNGGRLFRDTHASKIDDGPPPTVQTEEGHEILADAVVVATNVPVHTKFKIHTKQAPYRTYVIAARIPSGSVRRALYYDTLHPHHYVRTMRPTEGKSGGELLVVGGEDHKTGQADDAPDRWAALESWARERFPSMEAVDFRWSGQVAEPVDGVAFIGRDTEHVYLVTGDSGMGMTHGTIAGVLLTDLICQRENPWSRLYDPGRISLRAAGQFARENINVAGKYVAHLTPGDVDSVAAIGRGRGAILREGASKIAVFRDEGGQLHARSASCPHLGCIVAWNTAESTWDCPCHGSRFDPFGRVLTGPANRDLEPAGEKEKEEVPGRPERPQAPPPL